jgi:hypothetical protein
MAQFHDHRVETVQILEWRPGFLGTRNFMCIRGDLPCHIFLYLPATPPSRPVQARVHVRPHCHAISGHLVSLTRRSWSNSISPITCKTFSKRQNMTKKTKNADRNRPEMTTRSCFAPDVEEPSFQPQSPPFARHRDPASRSPHWAPGATPTPEPLALPRPRRLLAWASMAAARGAGGARISNAYLMLLGWRDEVFRHL